MNPDEIRMWENCEVKEDLSCVRSYEKDALCDDGKKDKYDCDVDFTDIKGDFITTSSCCGDHAEFIIDKINSNCYETSCTTNYKDDCVNSYKNDCVDNYNDDCVDSYNDSCKENYDNCNDSCTESYEDECKVECGQKNKKSKKRKNSNMNMMNLMNMKKIFEMGIQIGCQRGYAMADAQYRRKMMCIYRIISGK